MLACIVDFATANITHTPIGPFWTADKQSTRTTCGGTIGGAL